MPPPGFYAHATEVKLARTQLRVFGVDDRLRVR
jgi:hypothetical protein